MVNDQESNHSKSDRLLQIIQRDDKRTTSAGKAHGKLKIFLGMAAGVGKTFAMLSAAKQLRTQGHDVLVGWIDTHGRQDTINALSGLDVLPRKKVLHRGVDVETLDVDTIIERMPKLVLIDELANTNPPGSRHAKRYLDILEILEHGIDVFTTVNIQHLESRIDTVREITGVFVKETVPDSFLDLAAEVILIDLPPDELIKRLRDGKIYPVERIDTASKNFFRKGNLTALREMALRLSTERVDRELREFKLLNGIDSTWKSGSRLMVAIFASPYSESLIRTTRRLADIYGATWIGVHVESDAQMSDKEKDLLAKNISLVTQLGGEVISTRDDNTVEGILRVAKQNNVTQLIVGKSKRNAFQRLLSGGTIVSKLLNQSGSIDMIVVGQTIDTDLDFKNIKQPSTYLPKPSELGWILPYILVTWVLASGLNPWIGYRAVGMIFLMSVSVAGTFFSNYVVLGLALFFACVYNFFFIPPLYHFTVSNTEDAMLLAMMFFAALLTGRLTHKLKNKEKILKIRESRNIAIHSLSKEISKAHSLEDVLHITVEVTEKALGCSVAIFLLDRKHPQKLEHNINNTYDPSVKDLAVAMWTLENGKPAGKFTDTLPSAEGTFFPLIGATQVLGVLGVRTAGKSSFDIDQISLIETLIPQICSGIEREAFHVQNKSIQALEDAQKLYKTLLDCVSHELKTPLATIKASASALCDDRTVGNPSVVKTIGEKIFTSSLRLQRLVDNLLDMTRIESGMILAKAVPSDVRDLIGTVLGKFRQEYPQIHFNVSIPENTSSVTCDPILTDQALSNVIMNAVMYAPESNIIDIAVRDSNQYVEIIIRDHGQGFSNLERENVFHKFYRSHPEKTGGLGLGLSIVKGFIELQKGKVEISNHSKGGGQFHVFLPIYRDSSEQHIQALST